jgi:phosphoribosyl 1,2-cyclic phosphodiesterase
VHLDHIVGFPFFMPLWHSDFTTHIRAGSLNSYGGIKKFLTNTFVDPLFPVAFVDLPGNIVCEDFTPSTAHLIGNVRIDTFELNHPNGAVAYKLIFNGKSVAYVTDHEHGEGANRDGLIEFIRGSDIFIYDSSYDDDIYPKYKGWGHSTWQEALRLGKEADVIKTAIFHHDPQSTDDKMILIEKAVLKEAGDRAFVSKQDTIIKL